MKGCWLSCVGGAHLSVGVSVVLLCPGLVVLLYESKVFLPLALKDQLSALPVGRQVTLGGGGGRQKLTPEPERRRDRGGGRWRLTERSLHVIGRTSRGIPAQLCFRSSSVSSTGEKQRLRLASKACTQARAASSPRSVLGLASNSRNLSRRLLSRTAMGGAPEAFWSEIRATSGMTGRTGRARCFWSGAVHTKRPSLE